MKSPPAPRRWAGPKASSTRASRTADRGSRMLSAVPALGIPIYWPAKATSAASSSAAARSPGTNEPPPRRPSADSRHDGGGAPLSRAFDEANRPMLHPRDARDRAYEEPLGLATRAGR